MGNNADPFRDLLFAELAVVLEVASAKEVAAAIESYWEKRDRLEKSFGDRLTRVAGIAPDDLQQIEAQIDRLVRDAGGDTRKALMTHGVGSALRRSLPADSLVSREITTMEAPLRPIAKDRYEHIGPVGQGGMGVVVLARDRELQRPVALKMMRGDRPAADRFLREAQITGSLEHPGIVPIHEIGRTEEDVPYYTMRYVAGRRTLLDAIDKTATVDERLPLLEPFLRVCDTVRYAHSRGVLHCDIKPANIALGSFGETILLDWGLARAKNENGNGSRGTSGTPGYASPEAAGARPDEITERSDVYSLGATLYHVLTLSPPLEFESLDDMRQRLASEPAPRATAVNADVPEALSQLCERALAPDPADRFEDVAAFADAVRAWRQRDEIQREVAGLAREAHQALADADELPGDEQAHRLDRVLGLATRMRKLDPDSDAARLIEERAGRQRERLAHARDKAARSRLMKRVAVAALLVAAVTAVVMAAVLENRRAETDAARAETANERDRAEDLADFMLVDLREKLEAFGRIELLGDAARKALAYYDSVAAPQTVTARRKKALALASVGEVLRHEGSLDEAIAVQGRAIELFEQLHAEQPQDIQIARELARSHTEAIKMYDAAGDSDAAIAAAGRAQRLHKRLLASKLDRPDLRWKLEAAYASTLFELARLSSKHVDLVRAVEYARENVRIWRALANDHADDPQFRVSLGAAMRQLGEFLDDQGEMDEAARTYEEALGHLAGATSDSRTLREVAIVHSLLGDILVKHERFDEAAQHLEQALALRRSLAHTNPLDVSTQHDYAQGLMSMADLFTRSGKRAGSWAPAREAIAVLEGLVARDPASRFWPRQLSVALHTLGDMHRTVDDYPKAFEYVRRAVEIRRELMDVEPTLVSKRDLAHGLTALGRGYADLRQFDEAIARFQEARRMLNELATDNPTNRDLTGCWNAYWLADAYRGKRDAGAAREHYLLALAEHERAAAMQPDHPRIQCNMAEIHGWLGDIARKSGQPGPALTHYEQSRALAVELCKQENPGWRSLQALARANGLRGVVYLDGRSYKEAAAAFKEAAQDNQRLGAVRAASKSAQSWYDGRVRLTTMLSGEREPANALDHALLGEYAHHQRQHKEAVAHFERAFAADVRAKGADEYLAYAIRSAARSGQDAKALAWLRDFVKLTARRVAWADGELAKEKDEQRRVALRAQRDRWRRSVAFLRDKDPALAALRKLPEFRAAFN